MGIKNIPLKNIQMTDKQQTEHVHSACARMTNLPISTKHGVEISNYFRFKKTAFAKAYLEEIMQLKKALPFTKATMDLGHKPGMGSGRYPQKAAKFFLRLIQSAEANAQYKGLDTNSLVITKLLANKAAIPFTGKRQRFKTKRSHIEIEVTERKEKASKNESSSVKEKSKVEQKPKAKKTMPG